MALRLRHRKLKSVRRVGGAATEAAHRGFLPPIDVMVEGKMHALTMAAEGKLHADIQKKYTPPPGLGQLVGRYRQLQRERVAVTLLQEELQRLQAIQKNPRLGVKLFTRKYAKFSHIGSARRWPISWLLDKAIRTRRWALFQLGEVEVYRPDGKLAMTLSRRNVQPGISFLSGEIEKRMSAVAGNEAEFKAVSQKFDAEHGKLQRAIQERESGWK